VQEHSYNDPEELASEQVKKESRSLLGYSPLDIIEVNNRFSGGYRLRKDASPDAWNMVKRIVPASKANMPPAIEFLTLSERVELAKKTFSSETSDQTPKSIFDGQVVERNRTILPAVFSNPTVIRPFEDTDSTNPSIEKVKDLEDRAIQKICKTGT
jgi:hypothetical protein